jgi:predicted nucleotidyltransferase
VNHSQEDPVLEEAAPDSDYDFLVVVASSDERPLRRAQKAYRALRGLGVSKDVIVTRSASFDRMRILAASLEH